MEVLSFINWRSEMKFAKLRALINKATKWLSEFYQHTKCLKSFSQIVFMSVLLALNEAISINYEVDFAKINLIKNRVCFRKSES